MLIENTLSIELQETKKTANHRPNPHLKTLPQKTTKTQANQTNKGKVCSDSKILRKACQEVEVFSVFSTLSKNKSVN